MRAAPGEYHDLQPADVHGSGEHPDKRTTVVLENVNDGVLRNLRAAEGSATFLEFRGARTKDLWVHSNELKKAAQPAAFAGGAQWDLITLQ